MPLDIENLISDFASSERAEDDAVEWSIPASSAAATFRQDVKNWDDLLLWKPISHSLATAEWYAECVIAGTALFRDCVDIHPDIRGGRPVLKGTGFTVASTLAELSETSGVDEVAERFDLDAQTIRDLLDAMSLLFERSYRP